ncbi:hypothetical protein LSAT2_008237, partial [Lamellibrachia satsuma]
SVSSSASTAGVANAAVVVAFAVICLRSGNITTSADDLYFLEINLLPFRRCPWSSHVTASIDLSAKELVFELEFGASLTVRDQEKITTEKEISSSFNTVKRKRQGES